MTLAEIMGEGLYVFISMAITAVLIYEENRNIQWVVLTVILQMVGGVIIMKDLLTYPIVPICYLVLIFVFVYFLSHRKLNSQTK